MSSKRAMRLSQKQERSHEILAVAWKHFLQGSFESVTMARIADATGLAKGTLYLYFPTKDALFLAITEQQLCAWLDCLNEQLAELPPLSGPGVTARLIRDTLVSRPGMLRLLAIMHATVEAHATPETASSFRQAISTRMRVTASEFARVLPLAEPNEGVRAVLRCHALIIGMQQIGMPEHLIAIPSNVPEIDALRTHIAGELGSALEVLLRGMTRVDA